MRDRVGSALGKGRDETADPVGVLLDRRSIRDQDELVVVVGTPSSSTGTTRGSSPRSLRSTPSTFRKPPSIASALPPITAGSRLKPTFTSSTSDGLRPAVARMVSR